MEEPREGYWEGFWKSQDRHTMRYELLGEEIGEGQWMWSEERAKKAVENYREYQEVSEEGETIKEYWERSEGDPDFIKKENGTIKYWVKPKHYEILDNNWLDIPGYSGLTGFQTENSEDLLKRVIKITSDKNELVMDFFLGSGTTTAVAQKMNRKWIGVEMGHQFFNVVLPRMKEVIYYDSRGIAKDEDIKEQYNAEGAGGMFKYYDFEQYEQALKNCTYEDSRPFDSKRTPVYQQYVFLNDKKMIEVLDIDRESETIEIDLSNLYANIDIAETLANMKGKKIKSINRKSVEFEDEETVKYNQIPFEDIKPLIWWG